MTVNASRVTARYYEEAPAWVGCEECHGTGSYYYREKEKLKDPCVKCSGNQGHWHEAVDSLKLKFNVPAITKDTILEREVVRCRCRDVTNRTRTVTPYERGMLNQCPAKKIPRGECGCHKKLDICQTVGVRDWSFSRDRYLCRNDNCKSCWPDDHNHKFEDVCGCDGSGYIPIGGWRVKEADHE